MGIRSFLFGKEQRVTQAVERRDPTGATMRVGYGAKGLPMVSEWDAETAFRYAYLANVVVYRCVEIIAESLAACAFRVGTDPNKPEDYNPDAPLAQLLGPPPKGPNPEIAADDLIANSVAQFLVTGKFGWEMELEGGKDSRPVALWPLAAQHLRAVPTEGGNKYFSHFLYGPQGDAKKLREDQVFYHWKPSLIDHRQPESALQAARLDISVAVMQDRYDHAFLSNNAVPAALIVMQEFANDEEYEAFEEKMNAKYGGVNNAGKSMVVESAGGADGDVSKSVDIHQLGITQKDAEFIKRHELKFRNIAIGLGVPWSKLDASGRTYDNAQAEDDTFWINRMQPLMRRLQNRINMRLAPRLGKEVGWFDTAHVEVLKPKKLYQEVGLPSLVTGGILTVNEARGMVNQTPVEGGDEVLNPLATQLLQSGLGASIDNTVSDIPNEVPAKEPVVEAAEKIVKEIPTRAAPIDHEVRRLKILKKVDKQARLREARWRSKFKKLFVRQEKAVLDRLEGKRGRQAIERRDAVEPTDALFDKDFWRTETIDMTEDMYADLYELGAQRILDAFVRSKRSPAIDIDFSLEAPFVKEFIKAHANKLSGGVTDTTFDAIKTALSHGVAEGEGIPELSARVREVFTQASGYRAEMIARTEVLSGYNAAANLTAAQLPSDVVGGKEWIGEGTNDECTDYNGQVVLIGDGWDGMDAPPAHPNAVLAGTFIPYGELTEMVAAPYEGPAIRIDTDTKSLTIGPNHPVFTTTGLIRAKELRPGDQIFYDTRVEGSVARTSPTNLVKIPLLQDAFSSVRASHSVTRVPTTRHNLHGDGVFVKGEVDVVKVTDSLLPVLDLPGIQEFRKANFMRADSELLAITGEGSSSFLFDSIGSSTTSSMSGSSSSDGIGSVMTQDAPSTTAVLNAATPAKILTHIQPLTIRNVEIITHKGWSYDASTKAGAYLNDGFVVSNCRCTVAFLTPDEMKAYGYSTSRKMIEVRLAKRIIETVGKAA